MLLFIIIAAVILVGVLLLVLSNNLMDYYGDGLGATGCIFIGVGCFALAFSLCAFLIVCPQYISEIQEFMATEQTLEQIRLDDLTWEKAAIQTKVVEMNQWLARAKYWNGTMFDIYIPDRVMELEPIK